MRGALLAAAALAAAAPAHAGEATLGGVRVQALSPTLLRVEPQGPMGFEDRTTFLVTSRVSSGIAVSASWDEDGSALFKTQYYSVKVKRDNSSAPACAKVATGTDVNSPSRSLKYPGGAKAADRAACCALCQGDPTCSGYVFAGSEALIGENCWPLSGWTSTRSASNREVGCLRGCSSLEEVTVTAADGTLLWQQSKTPAQGTLHWPDPLSAQAYPLLDFPRFYVPEWGPEPVPAGKTVDPALKATNGYDFRNNVKGDTYVFLLANDLAGWQAARQDFIALTGPTPVLPDYAFGTWFTWWHSYTEAEAKNDISQWETLKLSIDIWALDMNWRYTKDHADRFYNHPNTELFPDFANNSTAWFDFLASKKLRTYFNDHPYPVAPQTSPQEVEFRWAGLTNWLKKGLTFWWFDRNWKFSIPPPNDDALGLTGGVWDGLTNAAWGSHLYHTTVANYDKEHRGAGERAITLTKFAPPDWRPGTDPSAADESPAQHRYPVWWTGDGVDLQASVHSMVDQGIYSFKPYVHSDCGGDYRGTAGDLLRWTAHCTLGTILRFHGNDHRSWTYDNHTVDIVREYLNMRYRLVPSLVAAGHEAAQTGFPLVARCDLYWPEHSESRSNEQYIHLKDTLVAPIWNSGSNQTKRSVWIPPGVWEDAWTGANVTGPQTVQTEQPYERIPMWHRRGGMVITASNPGMRVEDQDWTDLTVEAWPEDGAAQVRRGLYPLGGEQRTEVAMSTTGGAVRFAVSAAADGVARSWLLRLHLRPGQRVASVLIDGQEAQFSALQPSGAAARFPFGGAGAAPPPAAGAVAEIRIPSSAAAREAAVALSA